MAFQRIRIKNTNVAGKVPGADKLDTAELCVNLKDHKLYSKDADGDVFELGKGASVPGGDVPPSSGNEIGDLFFDTVNEILLYWDGNEWVPAAGEGYVKLNDEGVTQTITGGGGLGVQGDIASSTDVKAANIMQVGGVVSGYFTGSTLGGNGILSIINRAGGNLIQVAHHFAGNITGMIVDQYGNITADGGVTAAFGTTAVQMGNVMPRDDWSSISARN